MSVLIPSNLINFAPGPGSQAYADWRIIGSPMTGPAGVWQCPYVVNALAPTATSIVVGRLYGFPFPVSRRVTVDTISIETTIAGGAGSVTRVGIYQAISRTNAYPGALVVDAGEWDTTVTPAVLTKTINQTLGPDQLYWLAILCGANSATIRAMTATGLMSLGINPAGGGGSFTGISSTQSYGALPSTFNTLGSYNSNTQPLIAVHFSA